MKRTKVIIRKGGKKITLRVKSTKRNQSTDSHVCCPQDFCVKDDFFILDMVIRLASERDKLVDSDREHAFREEAERIMKLTTAMIESWRNDVEKIAKTLRKIGWKNAWRNRHFRETYNDAARWLAGGNDTENDIIFLATGIPNEVFVKEWKSKVVGAIKEYKQNKKKRAAMARACKKFIEKRRKERKQQILPVSPVEMIEQALL